MVSFILFSVLIPAVAQSLPGVRGADGAPVRMSSFLTLWTNTVQIYFRIAREILFLFSWISQLFFRFYLQGIFGPEGPPGYTGPRGPDGPPVCKQISTNSHLMYQYK